MILRMAAGVALIVCVTTSDALAQRERPPRFPAEKFSTRPVQPFLQGGPAGLSPPAKPDPVTRRGEQKRRWDERTRDPAFQPR
jgi:hypothetical protein